MSGDRLTARLGPDLAALVQDVGVPLARAMQITGLRSSVLTRATFRLDFRDGRRLKGRRFDEPAHAERVETLAGHVNLRALPRVLSRRGTALLEEWVPGAPLDRRRPTREHLRRAGALLGAIHRAGGPGPPGAKSPPTPAERLALVERGLQELAGVGALSPAVVGRLRDAARGHVPDQQKAGIIHRDFCAENLVVDASGMPHAVDNGTLTVDAYDFDLARTWYRWPMTPAERSAFEAGYAARRGLRAYRAHFPFWTVAVLVEAVLFRHHARTPGRRTPLRRLVGLLAALPPTRER